VLPGSDVEANEQWTLVRNARQLLTLQGTRGPRRGRAMADLGIVPHGAILIRNGLIEDIGPARRVENLAGAKRAHEIDATGKVVMPAFVDADMALVVPAPLERSDGSGPMYDSHVLRVMSRQRVQTRAADVATERARYGCLTVGARTPGATDLKNIGKVLRTHRALQGKPLRIRSIFCPQIPQGAEKFPVSMLELLTLKWLPSIRNKRLCSILEIDVGGPLAMLDRPMLRIIAIAAEELGYAIRLRSAKPLEAMYLELALAMGAIAIVAPNDDLPAFAEALAANGCVRVIPASEGFDNPAMAALELRKSIDEGAAIAIASSYRTTGASSFNMQFLLHLAVYHLGMKPEEAITATTWNPACSLRLSHVTGSLEPGKDADLLLMDVPDYRDLPRRAGHHDVSLVVKRGKAVFRSAALSSD
jgi:imidazolonepropionase